MYENDWTQAATRQRERIAHTIVDSALAGFDRADRRRRLARWRALITGGLLVAVAVAALVLGLPGTALAGAGPPEVSRAPVTPIPALFQPALDPVGQSTLVRDRDGVAATLTIEDLTPFRATTVWWAIFNDPAGCSNRCDDDDLFDATGALAPNRDARASLVWADGLVPAATTATFDLRLARATSEAPAPSEARIAAGPGLLNPTGAEIHLIVRQHGRPLAGPTLEAQLTSYTGGCATNGCRNTHLAVHRS